MTTKYKISTKKLSEGTLPEITRAIEETNTSRVGAIYKTLMLRDPQAYKQSANAIAVELEKTKEAKTLYNATALVTVEGKQFELDRLIPLLSLTLDGFIGICTILHNRTVNRQAFVGEVRDLIKGYSPHLTRNEISDVLAFIAWGMGLKKKYFPDEGYIFLPEKDQDKYGIPFSVRLYKGAIKKILKDHNA